MKKKIILISTISTVAIIIFFAFFKFKDKNNLNMAVMYTDKNYIANYCIYNNNKLTKIYKRENSNYSDIIYDNKNDKLYYSAVYNNSPNLFEIDLLKKNTNPKGILENDINADIIKSYNSNVFFRTLQKGHRNFTIGEYNTSNGQVNIWDKTPSDSTIYNFYCNKYNKKIYTIETSIKEMSTMKYPNTPTNKIIQYDENGDKKEELYSINKFINNISVNKGGTKCLIDASDSKSNKIYLIDLNTSKEEVLIDLNSDFNGIAFASYKNPQFSEDEKGFYFLATITDSQIIENIEGSDPIRMNGVYYYDFNSKKIKKIFQIPNVVINTFKLDNK